MTAFWSRHIRCYREGDRIVRHDIDCKDNTEHEPEGARRSLDAQPDHLGYVRRVLTDMMAHHALVDAEAQVKAQHENNEGARGILLARAKRDALFARKLRDLLNDETAFPQEPAPAVATVTVDVSDVEGLRGVIAAKTRLIEELVDEVAKLRRPDACAERVVIQAEAEVPELRALRKAVDLWDEFSDSSVIDFVDCFAEHVDHWRALVQRGNNASGGKRSGLDASPSPGAAVLPAVHPTTPARGPEEAGTSSAQRRPEAQRLSIGDLVDADNGPKLGGPPREVFVTSLHLCSDGRIQTGWTAIDTSRGGQPATSLTPKGRSWTDEEREAILHRMKKEEAFDRELEEEQRRSEATPLVEAARGIVDFATPVNEPPGACLVDAGRIDALRKALP